MNDQSNFVAKPVEHLALNKWAGSSIPRGVTNWSESMEHLRLNLNDVAAKTIHPRDYFFILLIRLPSVKLFRIDPVCFWYLNAI